jgi:hypothetical protein
MTYPALVAQQVLPGFEESIAVELAPHMRRYRCPAQAHKVWALRLEGGLARDYGVFGDYHRFPQLEQSEDAFHQ